jgi:hypothetical protein
VKFQFRPQYIRVALPPSSKRSLFGAFPTISFQGTQQVEIVGKLLQQSLDEKGVRLVGDAEVLPFVMFCNVIEPSCSRSRMVRYGSSKLVDGRWYTESSKEVHHCPILPNPQ